jgi:hypothetical protein
LFVVEKEREEEKGRGTDLEGDIKVRSETRNY